jgi:thioesterase domain-containing protein
LRAQGSLPPLFIIHGLGGSALLFRSLSARLPGDQPVFAITLPSGTVNSISEVAIETLAARYIEQIRLMHPTGPYNIAGHSFGALIAFEMAVQLGRTGEAPGLLALIEGDRHMIRDKSAEAVAAGHMLKLYQAKIKSLAEKGIAEVVRRRIGHIKLMRGVRLAQNSVAHPESARKPFEAKELLVLEARRYQPTPYTGKALLLRARDEVREPANRDLGWADLIGAGLEIVDIPGAHLTIFDEPNVSILASELNERLRSSHRPHVRSCDSQVCVN